MREMQDIILVGVEAVARGTLAASFPFALPFISPGLKPEQTPGLAQIRASTDYPSISDQVGVGNTVKFPITPDINVNTIRDIIKMATKRATGDLTSFSFKHSHRGLTGTNPVNRYLGCLVAGLRMGFSAGGSPGQDAVLAGSMDVETLGFTRANETLTGTQPTGNRFQLRHSTFDVNAVANAKVVGCEMNVVNEVDGGRPDASNIRIYLEEGFFVLDVMVRAKFENVNVRDLVDAQSDVPVTVTFKTGVANETVALAVPHSRIGERPLSTEGGVYIEQFRGLAFGTGSDPSALFTFGSAIGASALGL